jgi:hypothetical protein
MGRSSRHPSKGAGMSGDHNANQKPKSFLDDTTLADALQFLNDAAEMRPIQKRPTKLIVPRVYFDILMYRPPIKKARGVRARRRALTRRANATFLKLLKEFQ